VDRPAPERRYLARRPALDRQALALDDQETGIVLPAPEAGRERGAGLHHQDLASAFARGHRRGRPGVQVAAEHDVGAAVGERGRRLGRAGHRPLLDLGPVGERVMRRRDPGSPRRRLGEGVADAEHAGVAEAAGLPRRL
jgi:hypothetical protein